MSACSAPDLEPGPLTLLDEDTAIGPPEAPVFTPLAHEFSNSLPGVLSSLDGVFAAFDAEQAIDLGEGVLGALGASASTFASAVNPDALANLQAAEDGFRVARDKTASLQSWLPPDVQQPAHVTLVSFIVSDAAGARVPGALVTIDADFGQGTTRATDGTGGALLEFTPGATAAWTVTAPGFTEAHGVVTAAAQITVVRVTLGA